MIHQSPLQLADIFQDPDHVQENINGRVIMKGRNIGVEAGAKRVEDMGPKRNLQRSIALMTSLTKIIQTKSGSDLIHQKMEKKDIAARIGSHLGAEVIPGPGRVKGVIVVGVVTGKNPDQGAEKGSDDPGHAPDPDTVIEAKAGRKRRDLKNQGGIVGVEVGHHQAHQPLEGEIQLWMPKKLWLEDWKEQKNYRNSVKKNWLKSRNSKKVL